ncbi:MAG: hypothetical protein H7Z40_02010 [Phycisphaerae bacterium]|nr:hypothetical protein [Gemmatimonadaceae bacterium]
MQTRPGGTQTTNTDDKGRFELDNVPQGKQFLAFSNPALDSLGLGTLGNQVDVAGDGLPVRLTTPSFQTVWRTFCSGVVRASRGDSGIVWGTVRDADADTRLSGAAASVYHPKDFRAVEVYNSEFNVPMRYDSLGCGVVLFWTNRNPRW